MSWFGRRTPLAAARWAVIDCETSGLDVRRARLLSVGAVAVRGLRVELGESFAALVRQEEPSARENILVHGIGAEAQKSGAPLAEVIAALDAFVAGAVPVAFHAGFDAAILRRHGLKRRLRWLDLAALLPALFPDRAAKREGLDAWLAAFSIVPEARHDALGDAVDTAELLLVALAEAKRQRVETVEALIETERAGRWLGHR